MGLWLNYEHVNDFPAHFHSWTQSDRYAIALKFSQHEGSLLKAKTYNLKPYYYTGEGEQVMSGVSAMDLPLTEYIVGKLMWLLDDTGPEVFRWYMLLFSLLGLYYLSRIPGLLGFNPIHGLLLVFVLLLSPMYHYYIIGFLPSTGALAFYCIGLYFFAKNWLSEHKGHFLMSVVCFTLAALIRLPYVIHLLALLGGFVWFSWSRRSWAARELRAITVSILLVVLYWLYQRYVRGVYGSLFINELILPESWAASKAMLKAMYEEWRFDYLHWMGYIVLALLPIVLLLSFRKNIEASYKGLFWKVFLFSLAGYFCFVCAMLGQFQHHDYYGIDAFFPTMLIGLALVYTCVKKRGLIEWMAPISFVALLVWALPHLTERHEHRYFIQAWDLNHVTYQNFKGSKTFLDAEGIEPDARMLVIDAFTTNIPLIEMGRDGYTVLTTSEERMKEALTWPLDYVVLQDTFAIPEAVMNYNDIVNQLSFVCGNGKISVYRNRPPTSPSETLCKVFYHGERSYDGDAPDSNWNGYQAVQTEWVHSGNQAAHLPTEGVYSESLTLYPGRLGMLPETSKLVLTGYFKMDSINSEVSAVVSVMRGDSLVHYDRQYFVYRIHGAEGLERAVFHFELPAELKPEDEMKCYFWKEGEQNFYFDDLEAMLYQ